MMLVFIAGAVIVFFGARKLYSMIWAGNLGITIKADQAYTYEGENNVLSEVIENRKRLPLPVLEVAFRVGKGVRFFSMENAQVTDYLYKRDIYGMLGYQRITRKLPFVCERRGRYRVDQVEFTSFSLLHTLTVRQPVEDVGCSFSVYARRTDVSRIAATLAVLLGEVESKKRTLPDPFAFAGIRDYTIYDPMKTINWKASARAGSLKVNTYASTESQQVMIYLDEADPNIVKRPRLTEESISIAATLAGKLLKKGMECGLCANVVLPENENKAFFSFPPRKTRNQIPAIENALAYVAQPEDIVPFERVLLPPEGDKREIAVIISMNAAEKQKEIAELCSLFDQALVVIPYETGDEAPAIRIPGAAVLAREVGF